MNQQIMEILGQAAMKKLPQFLPQEITNTAWTLATLSISNTPLFLEISVESLVDDVDAAKQ